MTELKHGMKVHCTANSIDKQIGKDQTGRVGGFARFSPYHPLEVMVDLDTNPPTSDWFWVGSVTPIVENGK